MDYFTLISQQLGISILALLIIISWEGVWTAIAMWKAARNKHLVWFIVFFVLNLFGIPEIIYLILTRKKGRSKSRR